MGLISVLTGWARRISSSLRERPADWAQVLSLAIFVGAATAAGFVLERWIGLYSLAGAALVSVFVLGQR